MEGATHISCFAFNTDDFLGLFDNNDFLTHPLSMYFEIFNCTKDEMAYLRRILAEDNLNDIKKPEKNENFSFVSRQTFRQSKGKNRFLKQLFMCKFRDVSVKPNPYYFDLETSKNCNKVIQEINIIFALEQSPFGMMGGCLDADFTHYGTWIDEIHSAIQNGFQQEEAVAQNENSRSLVRSISMDKKISSAIAFRDFMF